MHPTTNINTNTHAVAVIMSAHVFGFYVFGAFASQPLQQAVWSTFFLKSIAVRTKQPENFTCQQQCRNSPPLFPLTRLSPRSYDQ